MAFLPSDHLARAPAWRATPGEPWRSYVVAAFAGLVVLAAVHALAFPGLSPADWLPALAGYAAGSSLVAALLARRFPHRTLGWCNIVTQARLAIVALLATPLLADGGLFAAVGMAGLSGSERVLASGGWLIAGLALFALALDGVDGWLARRQRLCSAFGARFDMEVDAAFALVLALHALGSGAAGPWVLVLGLARYAFAGAARVWPWLARPLPDRVSRKAVCVAQLAVLIALQVPVVPDAAAQLAGIGVALALLWSFGRDVAWLRRARAGDGWA